MSTEFVAARHDAALPGLACGTHVMTMRGEVAVERLQPGDRALGLRTSCLLPISWIGRRHVADTGLPCPQALCPIRIMAAAFDDGIPMRDLVVSPACWLLIDGMLLQARHLLNGRTVIAESGGPVTYFALGLTHPEILLAEGAPVSSLSDPALRAMFDNPVGWRADREPALGASLTPPVATGAQHYAVRHRLLCRAAAMAGSSTPDPEPVLLADGLPLLPELQPDGLLRFMVPAGTASLLLQSRAAVPGALGPGDMRLLGVAVSELWCDAERIGLDDSGLQDGWHEAEGVGAPIRWTDGLARLPPARDTIRMRIHPLPAYPSHLLVR